MLARILSAALVGVEAALVRVEVDVTPGLPAFTTVGLPDSAVRESRERVRTAIRNAGFPFPADRITVNLAPADLRKEGASFDLPIALAILAATGAVTNGQIGPFAVVGELALDGQIQAVRGALGPDRPNQSFDVNSLAARDLVGPGLIGIELEEGEPATLAARVVSPGGGNHSQPDVLPR